MHLSGGVGTGVCLLLFFDAEVNNKDSLISVLFFLLFCMLSTAQNAVGFFKKPLMILPSASEISAPRQEAAEQGETQNENEANILHFFIVLRASSFLFTRGK